ncbi:serine hydrolase domain-containing protein [Vagococcus sp. JNUCC 83]
MKKSRIEYDRLKRKQKWLSFLFFLIGILATLSLVVTIFILYPNKIIGLADQTKKEEMTFSSSSAEQSETSSSSDISTEASSFVPRTNFDTSAETPLLLKPLKDKLEQDIASRELSGTLLAIKNNQVVMYNSFGYATDVPWKAQESTYMIASIQKFYTAILVSTLISENKLTLETTLNKFYPEIPGSDQITIDSMLSMTSGLKLDTGKAPTTIKTQKDWEQYILKTTTHQNSTDWDYSPVNFGLLAMIIEKITGQSYEDYFNKVVKEPLNLKQTGFYTELSNTTHLVPVYEENGTPKKSDIPDYAYTRELGTGNMYVSPKDFAIVVQALMDGQFEDLNNIKMTWIKDLPYGTTYYKSGVYRKVINQNEPAIFWGHGIFRGYEPTVIFNDDASDMIIYFSNQYLTNKSNTIATQEFYNIISSPVTFNEGNY